MFGGGLVVDRDFFNSIIKIDNIINLTLFFTIKRIEFFVDMVDMK